MLAVPDRQQVPEKVSVSATMDFSEMTGGFTAKLGNSKLLMQVLKAIHFKDDATILINGNGLKVTIEDAKSFQV